jgi:hypothetical protein
MQAHSNPENRVWLGLGVLALGGGAWAVYRFKQRKKLEKELEDSPSVKLATELGLVKWTPKEKAAELIALSESKGPDAALAEVMVEVREVLATQGGEAEEGALAELATAASAAGTKAKQYIEAQTGVDLDPYMTQARDTTREGWNWMSSWWTDEPEAKENPRITWSQYLADLE